MLNINESATHSMLIQKNGPSIVLAVDGSCASDVGKSSEIPRWPTMEVPTGRIRASVPFVQGSSHSHMCADRQLLILFAR